MYGREYGGKTLNFEPSGGLIHASLVMQDKETDSYWSIMTGDSLAGTFKGTRLVELPLGAKMQWKDWRAKHPATLVLSVDGVEHEDRNDYDSYFDSADGPLGAQANDLRLRTKETIYSFQLDGRAYAVPFSQFTAGGVFEAGGKHLLLYRPEGVEMFYSTLAFQSTEGGFEQRDGSWHHSASGAVLDPETARFANAAGREIPRLEGFDTFWYNWSSTHPETEILQPVTK